MYYAQYTLIRTDSKNNPFLVILVLVGLLQHILMFEKYPNNDFGHGRHSKLLRINSHHFPKYTSDVCHCIVILPLYWILQQTMLFLYSWKKLYGPLSGNRGLWIHLMYSMCQEHFWCMWQEDTANVPNLQTLFQYWNHFPFIPTTEV